MNYSRDMGVFRYNMVFDIDGMGDRAQRASEQSAYECGEYIRSESTAIAPYREGHLVESAHVIPHGAASVLIEYGIVYARYQHDNTRLRHPNGRQAKYLQSVMENPATLQAMQSIFAKHLKKEL